MEGAQWQWWMALLLLESIQPRMHCEDLVAQTLKGHSVTRLFFPEGPLLIGNKHKPQL